jgi:hypothetical protein
VIERTRHRYGEGPAAEIDRLVEQVAANAEEATRWFLTPAATVDEQDAYLAKGNEHFSRRAELQRKIHDILDTALAAVAASEEGDEGDE